MTRSLLKRVSAPLALVALASTALAQKPTLDARAVASVDFPVSCASGVQADFGRGVASLHHMTYPAARGLFEKVAARDPGCAMAHWGIAMTLFQPLWPTRPGPADLERGRQAVARAREIGLPTDRERLLVDAAAAFFDDQASDYWQRIRRWDRAMESAHVALPGDAEIAAFRALALLAVAPVDTGSRSHAADAAALLRPILARNPTHPGAQHYLVHANDAAGREHDSPDVVRGYAANAPRNPHALHMPTHIYTRLGDWPSVIRGNQQAAAAALEQPAGEQGEFVWDEFPHAVEYLVYAWLQMGMDDSAAAQVRRLRTTERLQPTFKTAFHLASTQARTALERRQWSAAASLPPREPGNLDWDRFMWAEAVTWFARGLGAAHLARMADADTAAARLRTLEQQAAGAGEDLFARNIRLLGLELGAWIAHSRGDAAASVRLMEKAVALELATPKHAVTPAPALPAAELLGDLFMEQRRPDGALRSYRRSLELYPRRFNSLLGAARAARASGDVALARRYYRELVEMTGAGARPAALSEARVRSR